MPPKRSTRVLELLVSSKYTLPAFYEDAQTSEIEQALTLGALVCETVTSAKASAELQDILAKKHAEFEHLKEQFAEQTSEIQQKTAEQLHRAETQKLEEIAYIKSQTQQKISEIQSEIASVTEERQILLAKHAKELKEIYEHQKVDENTIRQTERNAVTQQMNQRIQQLQTEIHVAHETIAGLHQRKTQLEESRDTDIRNAKEQTMSLLNLAMEEKDKRILACQETIRLHNESYVNLADTLRQLTESVTRKSANVKLKGNQFEGELRTILLQCFGTGERFKLVDSASFGIGHAGDIIMHWGDEQILWEGKNYDHPVPTAEVEKFRRDMRENRTMRVGVMVSKRSAITGMTERGDMYTEFIDGQMLIYISRFDDVSKSTLPLLMELFHVHWNSDAISERDESKDSAIRSIVELHGKAQRAKTEWRRQRSVMMEAIQFMAELVDTNEEAIQRTLTNLRAGTVIKHHDVPASLFRPTHGDEKLEQTIQIILEATTLKEGSVISLNDLADILAKQKALSRDTAKTHIKAVLQDTAFDAVKGRPTMLRGMELRRNDDSILTHVS